MKTIAVHNGQLFSRVLIFCLMIASAACQADLPDTPVFSSPTDKPETITAIPSRTPQETLTATAEPTATASVLPPSPTIAASQTPTLTPTAIPPSLPESGQVISLENAAGLQEVGRWGEGMIISKRAISGGELDLVTTTYGMRILRVSTGEELADFGDVAQMLISDEMDILAVAYQANSSVEIWQLPETELIATLEYAIEAPRYPPEYFSLADYQSVVAMQFSRDGGLLAIAYGNAEITLWRTETWEPAVVLSSNISNVSYKLIFSQDGQYLASLEAGGALGESTGNPRLVFWNLSDFSLRGYLANPGYVGENPFSSDSTYLATTQDYKVLIYKMSDFSLFRSFATGSDRWEAEIAFSPDDAYIIVDNRQVRRFSDGRRMNAEPEAELLAEWGLTAAPEAELAGVDLQTLEANGYYPAFDQIKLSEEDDRLLAWGSNGERLYWFRLPEEEFSQVELGAEMMNQAALAPDGQILAICLKSKELALVDLATGEVKKIPGCRENGLLAYLPDGRLLRANGTLVDVVQLPERVVVNTLRGHSTLLSQIYTNSKSAMFLTATQKLTTYAEVFLWTTQPLLARVTSFTISDHNPGDSPGVNALAISPNEEQFAVARASGDVDGFNLRGEYALWQARVDVISALAYSPDSSLLALGDFSGGVKLVDTRLGKQIYPAEMDGRNWTLYPIRAISFLPDGSGFYTAGGDGVIRLWGVPNP